MEKAIFSTPLSSSAGTRLGSPPSRFTINAASPRTGSHVRRGGLSRDKCSSAQPCWTSPALSKATTGPVSTTTFLATLHIGQDRLIKVPLIGRSVARALKGSDQISREVGAAQLTKRPRPLEQSGFKRFANYLGLGY